jgi:hypothetical protein
LASIDECFEWALRNTFDDLGIPDDGMIDYLAGLLSHFVVNAHLTSVTLAGGRVERLSDRLAEIQRVWQLETPDFTPEREVELRRQIGDYTLFMSGYFWERVHEASVVRHYAREGARGYRFAAEYHRAHRHPEARVFQALASGFDLYAVVLAYMRDVYQGDAFAIAPETARE